MIGGCTSGNRTLGIMVIVGEDVGVSVYGLVGDQVASTPVGVCVSGFPTFGVGYRVLAGRADGNGGGGRGCE